MSARLMAGHHARKHLDALQARIVALKAEHRAIEKRGPSKEECREEDARSVARFIYRHPLITLDHDSNAAGLRWFIEDRGEDRAIELLMAQRVKMGQAFGPPRAERQAKLTELEEQIRELSAAEEREVLRLEADGFTVLRRPDIDGALVVSVWRETLAEGAAA